MIVLIALKGKQHRPRWVPKRCNVHTYGKPKALPQGDLFTQEFADPRCTCARAKAREWWVIECKSRADAIQAAKMWPEASHHASVVEHGRNGKSYASRIVE